MAQGPKCSLCSDLATLEFSIKARWKFTSLLVLLLFWLVWVFCLWRSWTRDSRGEKEEDNSSPAPVDTDICGFWRWRMCPCVFWRIYSLKPLLFYEVHGTEAFLGCSNLTQALSIVRGVCWLCCCISLLSGLSWEYFWWAINHLQMYFQTQFSILFTDHERERNCPNASAPWLCRMEICNFSWGINNNPRCWQAIKVRKFSWFNNLEVIKFAHKWLEAPVVHFVPQFVLLTTEGLVWGWGGSGALVDPIPWGWAGYEQPKPFLMPCAGCEHPQTGDKPQLQVTLWASLGGLIQKKVGRPQWIREVLAWLTQWDTEGRMSSGWFISGFCFQVS